ncbi:helix-turn-helix domain-containing protein [Streptomyces fuscigenes]|uniref:helix-turn-helix domain-containing protein n=1 Tax=Streptomyces fuscigenes TaxID=1528880 RepID=UPI001F282A7C|nr:helix-turn-helix domain-containing protein [Streptomyces fuscigenes]MCF3961139.1 TetR/AcrR family transcriptional regulator [Streptomyces fuscigenes]
MPPNPRQPGPAARDPRGTHAPAPVPTGRPEPRRRDAAASRERLLTAAGELFAERGYDRTTARDIGERAGVDPSMIARYFGGKAQLFIAVLNAENDAESFADLFDDARLAGLFERIDRQGPGPVTQVAVRPYDDPAAQAAAAEELDRRIVGPLREHFAERDDEQGALKAELLAAAFVGVALARRAGTLRQLAAADPADLLPLVHRLLR